MDAEAAQMIGAGLAAIGAGIAAGGVGNVFSSFLQGAFAIAEEIRASVLSLRVQQQGQQLRTFVLHLDRAPGEGVGFLQSGFALQAQAPR